MADSPKALAYEIEQRVLALFMATAGDGETAPGFPEAVANFAQFMMDNRGVILACLRASPAESAASEREPPPGLLMSMAVRYDHGLGMPGYYDQGIFKLTGHTASHSDRLRSTLSTMHQLWEEVTGNGFYRPEKEADYVAMRDRALSDQPAGGMPDA